ncbi:MAG: hypothetical protein H6806_07335 [Planctomycetes bacterium]|nr:hypothetical protein [Planctomycetota bacterium]MCB9829557.1 hypothetical protein [Planctomycetota bacterium]
MKPPEMTGPLRVETVDGHTWVVGDGIACLCGDRAEADGLLADLRLRLGTSLLRAVEQAFATLASRGWITRIERDTTGAVCRAFDARPDAPGFAALCHPIPGDYAVIEAGEGIGDEEADLDAAAVVATALRDAGLTTSVELREGAAYVTVRGGTR